MLIAAFSNALNSRTAIRFTVRVGGEIDDAQVNAQVADRFIGIGRSLGLGDAQIPDIRTADQVRAAGLPGRVVEIAALEVSHYKLPNRAARQGVEAHPIQTHQAIDAGIVADAAVGGEGWANCYRYLREM